MAGPSSDEEGAGDLERRLRAVEDELAVRRVVLSYGPSVDAGHAARAASLWVEDGIYDADARGEPYVGRNAIEAMLEGDGHAKLMSEGVAHFAGPPLVHVDGDTASALTYSIVLRRDAEGRRYFVWRLSAARWDLERHDGQWKVRNRIHRAMDESGVGKELFGASLRALPHDVGGASR